MSTKPKAKSVTLEIETTLTNDELENAAVWNARYVAPALRRSIKVRSARATNVEPVKPPEPAGEE